jgi:hypothetical protein
LADTNVNSECAENTQPRDIASLARSELHNTTVFFTEDEPDTDAYGRRRHWFGKPSQRGYRLSTPHMRSTHDGFGAANLRVDEIINKHPHIAPTLKKIFVATQNPSVQTTLIAGFKRSDQHESGHCHRDDFVNTVFDSIKGVKPAELMQLVNAITEEYAENVNYEEFITMVERFGGDFGGNEFKFQSIEHPTKNAISQDDRNLVFRVKHALSQASGGLVGVE